MSDQDEIKKQAELVRIMLLKAKKSREDLQKIRKLLKKKEK